MASGLHPRAATTPLVAVVMATYNGGRHLPEMLASLAAQNWPSLHLIACDDGSSDETPEMLQKASGVSVELHRNAVRLGPLGNFSHALSLAKADYVALADQDDVWLPGKLDAMVACLRDLEREHGADTPLLVYSDVRIVNDDLQEIAPSFFEGGFKSREARTLQDFAISNHFPGCATIVNQALLRCALPVPARAYMHDWWLNLVAATFGQIGHVAEPLILFRRHGDNATGSGRPKQRESALAKITSRLVRLGSYVRARRAHAIEQARQANIHLAELDLRFGAAIPPAARARLEALRSGSITRRWKALSDARTGESRATNVIVASAMGWRSTRPR